MLNAMIRKALLYLIIIGPGLSLAAAKTAIHGEAVSYAGKEITFFRKSDIITGSDEIVAKCMVSDSGNFSAIVELSQTTQLYSYLGIYLGYFYAEPGSEYDLILPEFRDKSPDELLNPYFEPVELHLGISNFSSEDINMLIVMFEDAYIPYYDKHVNTIYSGPDVKKIDEDIRQIEQSFTSYRDTYFNIYRKYRYGMLKLLANRQRVQSLSDEYFNDQPVWYSNVAYTDLFNQVFHKYFSFFGRTDSGRKIYSDINEKGSYHELLKTLASSGNFDNDTLTELVILKQLHDEFYGSEFSRNGLIRILDSLVASTQIEEHALIGRNIKYKITRLLSGYEPPLFKLEDINGNMVSLADLKGKYVYLNFCTCQSYACLNEFNLLATLHQKHKERLTIVTISTDPKEEILRQFLANNNYNWLFLYYDRQPEVIKEYDVRAFPTYFLIGPDGKLILSPAVSPSENFEQRLFEIMKSRGDL
jgi:peroxiredoxin